MNITIFVRDSLGKQTMEVPSQLQNLHGCCLFLNLQVFRCDVGAFQSENQNEQ